MANNNIHGVIVVDKPAGMTSHDVIYKMRRVLGTKKVGHTGTLDPSVTGVLPIVIGDATKLTEILQERDKRYSACSHSGAQPTLKMHRVKHLNQGSLRMAV